MIGLGTMGRNLVYNLADHGYAVAGLGRTQDRVTELHRQAGNLPVHGYTDPEAFIRNLKTPRAIILLVPAGKPVDDVIEELLPLMDKGDLLIDGGNSYYKDTERRIVELEAKGFAFFGMGVSGGEDGARHGPSMMPGGTESVWERVKPMLEAVSAKAEDGLPCVDLVGPGGSGHYVKTVHNGIEYGIMQLIAEIYDVMHRGHGKSNEEIHSLFKSWDSGVLKSFLVQITHEVLSVKDEASGKDLVDLISDKAKQKGTGKWTSQDAMDLGVPVPTIDAAVGARELSSLKPDREKAEAIYKLNLTSEKSTDQELHDAFYAATILTYAQGFAQLEAASQEYGYHLQLAKVAKIWRAGCIIRSAFLQNIMDAFGRDAGFSNLLLDSEIATLMERLQLSLRKVVARTSMAGIPNPAFAASLAYFDSFRTGRLPANLIQAQRDYFGAHTYERLDQPGVFHTKWAEAAEHE
jgi:6-phosphogluconate dehydrogenase